MFISFKTIAPFTLLLLVTGLSHSQVDQQAVDDFARNFSYRNRIHIDEIQSILDQATFQPSIIEKISKPAEGMPWHRYRNIFMKDDRINAGVAFWEENEEVLNVVSDKTGVPPEIMVGILGVETYYGERKGNYKILDALYTLSFGYPRRAKFFRSELEDFILLTKKENINIYDVKGSYAGAMGYSQFMPSSYEAYAVSYDEGGTRDLMNSVEDAIASIGNYLADHRWKRGEPITQQVETRGHQKLGKQSLRPKHSTNYYADFGYHPTEEVKSGSLVTLLSFDQPEEKEYWFGLHNFYVITRYNHSPLYAMAVYQLAEAIKEQRQ